MTIKRYTPKFKKLHRFKYAIWLEKGAKIRRFEKQKWSSLKKTYYRKRYKFFPQNKMVLRSQPYDKDVKPLRMKKTFKLFLLERQRFRYYYGGGRLKLYQTKNLARRAIYKFKNSINRGSSAAFSLLENRLQSLLYHLRFVESFMDARKAIQMGYFRISTHKCFAPLRHLKKSEVLMVDPLFVSTLAARYLLQVNLFFYFRFSRRRRLYIFRKKSAFLNSLIINYPSTLFISFNSQLKCLVKEKKKF